MAALIRRKIVGCQGQSQEVFEMRGEARIRRTGKAKGEEDSSRKTGTAVHFRAQFQSNLFKAT
jgi:hypothetical protein